MTWQPIETAPKLESVVLYRSGWCNALAIGYWSLDDEEWKIGPFSLFPGATHWMPLPPPPTD